LISLCGITERGDSLRSIASTFTDGRSRIRTTKNHGKRQYNPDACIEFESASLFAGQNAHQGHICEDAQSVGCLLWPQNTATSSTQVHEAHGVHLESGIMTQISKRIPPNAQRLRTHFTMRSGIWDVSLIAALLEDEYMTVT
jgi:hypothetical protein